MPRPLLPRSLLPLLPAWRRRAAARRGSSALGALVALGTSATMMLGTAVLGSCRGRVPPGDDDATGAGEGEGEGEGEFVWPPCVVEEDCASLGPGHMCMNGGCMLMEVDAPAVAQPAPVEAALEAPLLVDVDPDPGVFVARLTAAERNVALVPGAPPTTMWVYVDDHGDGIPRVPGPRVEVETGTRVRIHFTNALPVDTTIHWHGLVLPAEMDGSGMPGTVVAPGASFDFDFVAPAPSLYWFHPHVQGDEQIERGLYAAFVVRTGRAEAVAREPEVGVDVDAERILVLDDVLLDDAAQVVPPARGSVMLPDGRMTFEGMMGRQGNRLLVNGVANPFVDVRPGSVERWRVVNVANARFFRLTLAGHRFVQIGSDVGLVPVPRTLNGLLIAPGERYDLLVAFDAVADVEGATLPLVTLHHDRGHDMADPGPLTVATLRMGAPKTPATPLPATTAGFVPLAASSTPAQRVVMDEQVLRGGKVGFSLNAELFPDVTPLVAAHDAVETWAIENKTHMDHPFHLHGAPFQVVSIEAKDGVVVDATFAEWKDVVIVPPESTLRFVVRYERAGMWMFHCHILEHAERGMMGMIDVGTAH
jgi:FtsP/CotA-like multicopper oxidase with cupredoxin domain